MHFSVAVLAVLGCLPACLHAQSVIPVQVGQNGFFFDPPTVTAQVGDIISFVFSGSNHTVTQSSSDTPCSPLAGGFSSGLVAEDGVIASSPVVWNLTVEDVSSTIWYFCENTQPQNHCNAGMVGAINPPSIDSFSSFLDLAKTASEDASPTFIPVLTGVGASASASPSSASSTGSATTEGSGSSTSSATIAPSPTKSSARQATGFSSALLVILLAMALLACL